jgi:hypothetical protein
MDFRASSPNRWSGLARPWGAAGFERRRSDRFAINIGKDDLRNPWVGGALSSFVFEPVVNERSSCVKQLLNYLLSRSAGRSQGRREPGRFAREALTACRRGGYQSKI